MSATLSRATRIPWLGLRGPRISTRSRTHLFLKHLHLTIITHGNKVELVQRLYAAHLEAGRDAKYGPATSEGTTGEGERERERERGPKLRQQELIHLKRFRLIGIL